MDLFRRSIRSMIALIIVVLSLLSAFLNKEIFVRTLPILSLILGYYFGKNN